MAAKIVSVASAATEGLLTRSVEHLAKLAVLDHGDDLKLHEVAPHQRKLRERPDVVAFKQVETAAEIRSRPPAEQFGTFRGSSAGCLKSPDRLVARFGVRLQGEGQHELHRAFPFSLRGSRLPGPRAQVRASPHVGCILGAPGRWGARPAPTEMSVQPGEHSLAKNVLSLWNPNRRKQTLLLGVSVIASGGGSFTPR